MDIQPSILQTTSYVGSQGSWKLIPASLLIKIYGNVIVILIGKDLEYNNSQAAHAGVIRCTFGFLFDCMWLSS